MFKDSITEKCIKMETFIQQPLDYALIVLLQKL